MIKVRIQRISKSCLEDLGICLCLQLCSFVVRVCCSVFSFVCSSVAVRSLQFAFTVSVQFTPAKCFSV